MTKLPKSHKPKALRPQKPTKLERRKTVMYGAGYEYEPGDFGMFAGPTPSLKKILEEIPEKPKARIIRFNLDMTDEVIYRWNRIEEMWVRYSEHEMVNKTIKRKRVSRNLG